MNEKKNIDRLFQEKFKDFDVAPPEKVWQGIKAELGEKKERRVIPLWFRLSGVAAILIIGLLLVTPVFNGIDTGDKPVVIEGRESDGNGSGRIKPGKPIRQHDPQTAGRSVQENSAVVSAGSPATKTGNNKNAAKESSPFKNNNSAVAYDDRPGGSKANSGTNIQKRSSNGNGPVSQPNATGLQPGEAVAYQQGRNKTQQTGSNNQKDNGDGRINNNVPDPSRNKDAVAVTPEKTRDARNRNGNNVDDIDTGTPSQIINRDIPVSDAVAENPVDSTAIVPENELEKILQDKLNGKEDEEKALAEADAKGKWNIKPQVAPVFYNSLSQGSPIGDEFEGNSKDFNNNLSYGVGVNYALTDRLSIRSGVNTVNLSYATNDIQFHASLDEQTSNVARRSNVANIVVQNQGSSPVPFNPVNVAADQLPVQTFDGSMIQKMGYIEVPLELSYSLVNKKFGIDVIGGVSTLFLNDNNVSVVSTQGYSTDVGEAQNLNNVHFSTNLGLGFRYRFWKAFEANFEPTFKYQVNPFTAGAGNFKPYFVGLYSGISFSF